MKPKICYIETHWSKRQGLPKDQQYSGIGYYRVVKPTEYLRQLGYEVDWFTEDFSIHIARDDNYIANTVEFFKGYDVVITKPTDNFHAAKAIFAACDILKIPLVIDYDDNYLTLSESNPAIDEGYRKGDKRRTIFLTFLSFADAVFVSTEPLKQYYSGVLKEIGQEKPIFVLPNCNVVEDWDFPSIEAKDKVVIGWHGSVTHDEDLHMVFPAIRKVMNKHDNVYLLLVGGATVETLKPLSLWPDRLLDRVAGIAGTQSWQKTEKTKGFPEYLMEQPFTIGICPLVDNEFNRGKSHIKWMEMAMKKIPIVASKVYPYSEPIQGTPTIESGFSGILVENTTDDWFNALDNLVINSEKRKEVGDNAYKAVKSNWQYKNHIKKWDEAIQKVVEGASDK